MKFRSYEALRIFNVAANRMSFTQAAIQLNLTKGAISYQIKRLEEDLGFAVFYRSHGGISLTDRGKQVLSASKSIFNSFETEIAKIKDQNHPGITIGMSTYFASRWLASRLMQFTAAYPAISIRLQPMIDLLDVRQQSIDMAIRWGSGEWSDMQIEPLFNCPAYATAGKTISREIRICGLEEVMNRVTLLHDRDGSRAWQEWHAHAGLPFRPHRGELVIPDPNVRVQAVISGQGMALNDALISDEITKGHLYKISDTELKDYGYFLAYPQGALSNPSVKAFRDWIIEAAGQ